LRLEPQRYTLPDVIASDRRERGNLAFAPTCHLIGAADNNLQLILTGRITSVRIIVARLPADNVMGANWIRRGWKRQGLRVEVQLARKTSWEKSIANYDMAMAA
jgi:hypothetical protein